MTVRNKITLTFTLLSGTFLLGVFIIIYVLTDGYTKQEFEDRMMERAAIVGQRALEKDEVSTAIYNQIIEQHWQKLPMERELLLLVDTATGRILDAHSPALRQDFVSKVLEKGYSITADADTLTVGLLYIDNEGNYLVVVSAYDRYGHSKMDYLRNVLIVSFILGLLSIYFIGRIYAGEVLSPIDKITVQTNSITASSLHLRLEAKDSKDELSRLSATINGMLDRLEGAFDAQTHFVNNASHELRNPLASILGETEIALKKERSVEEYQQALKNIETSAGRLDELVTSLLKLAQAEHDMAVDMELVRVDELVIEAQTLITPRVNNRAVFDYSQLPNDSTALEAVGNKSLLKLAVGNLIENACKFSDKEVVIKLIATDDKITITITDSGIGIPEKDLKNITAPFYRGGNVMGLKGVGIGLSLTQSIVKLHNGAFQLESTEGIGTVARIILPKGKF